MSELVRKETSSVPLNGYVGWYGGKRSQTWRTPDALFQELHEKYRFTMDGAADEGNGLLPKASTAEQPLSWKGERVFCNPPWSNIAPFVELGSTADLAVLLVPSRTNARWFHRALALGAITRYFPRKPRFVGAKWNSPTDCLLLEYDALRCTACGRIHAVACEGRAS